MIQTETRRLNYDCVALTYLMAGSGRAPNAETDKLFTLAFLLARGKTADVGPNTKSIKYPQAMGRPDL